ncbi:hypothetical protein C8R44DRAFT_750454 [Mycena epipterygia]|nr:hypothetical protein C8R44DRAFT_750454 [Mycena epipterygia]
MPHDAGTRQRRTNIKKNRPRRAFVRRACFKVRESEGLKIVFQQSNADSEPWGHLANFLVHMSGYNFSLPSVKIYFELIVFCLQMTRRLLVPFELCRVLEYKRVQNASCVTQWGTHVPSCQGYNSLMVAGTGYGKSVIFEDLAALNKARIVDEAQKKGLKAIMVNEDAVCPEVWASLRQGNGNLYYVSPEMVLLQLHSFVAGSKFSDESNAPSTVHHVIHRAPKSPEIFRHAGGITSRARLSKTDEDRIDTEKEKIQGVLSPGKKYQSTARDTRYIQ